MRITWENIDNFRITRNGLFRDITKRYSSGWKLTFCEYCGDECFIRNKDKKNKFCSNTCFHNSRRTGEII